MEQQIPSVLFKQMMSEKSYFLVGAESVLDVEQGLGDYWLNRVNLNLHLGYGVKPKIFIEFGIQPELSCPKTHFLGKDTFFG